MTRFSINMMVIGVLQHHIFAHSKHNSLSEAALLVSSETKTGGHLPCGCILVAPRLVSELASEGASGRLLCQVRGVISAAIF